MEEMTSHWVVFWRDFALGENIYFILASPNGIKQVTLKFVLQYFL